MTKHCLAIWLKDISGSVEHPRVLLCRRDDAEWFSSEKGQRGNSRPSLGLGTNEKVPMREGGEDRILMGVTMNFQPF